MFSSSGCVSSASRHGTEFSLSSNSDRIYNVINLIKNLLLGNIYSTILYCKSIGVYDTVWTNLYLYKTKNQAIREFPLPIQLIFSCHCWIWVFFFLLLKYVIHTLNLLLMFKQHNLPVEPPACDILLSWLSSWPLGFLGSLRGVYNLFPYLHFPVVVGSWMALSALRLY